MQNYFKQFLLLVTLASSLIACPTTRPPIVTELIANGGFETTNADWTFSQTGAARGTQAYCAKSGVAYGALNTQGGSNGSDPQISQFIVMPTEGKTTLEFTVRVDTLEAPGTSADSVRLFVGYGTAISSATITTGNNRDRFITQTVDITNRTGTPVEGGQEIEVYFKAAFFGAKPTVFCIDDVSVKNVR
jgi:hypothetical protein